MTSGEEKRRSKKEKERASHPTLTEHMLKCDRREEESEIRIQGPRRFGLPEKEGSETRDSGEWNAA